MSSAGFLCTLKIMITPVSANLSRGLLAHCNFESRLIFQFGTIRFTRRQCLTVWVLTVWSLIVRRVLIFLFPLILNALS